MTDPVTPVITVTPTVRDGTVVRWYTNVAAAEAGSAAMTVSRNGVFVNIPLHEVPAEWLETANQSYERLRAYSRADLSHLATHRKTRMSGPVEPITKETA